MLKVIAEFVLLNAAISKMCAVLEVGQKEDLTFWGQLETLFKEKSSASRRLLISAKPSSADEPDTKSMLSRFTSEDVHN